MKWAGVVLAVVLLATAVYYLLPHNQTIDADRRFDIPQNPAISTSGWETYNNSRYGYSFYYPSGWEVYGTGDRIMLMTPGQAAAQKACIASGANEPCGPTQVGSAYFEVLVGKTGQYAKGKMVQTTLNSQTAQFYVSSVVTERNYWVLRDAGLEFLVAAITDKEAQGPDQQTAVAIAHTFTLNK